MTTNPVRTPVADMNPPMTVKTRRSHGASSGAAASISANVLPIYRKSSGSRGGRNNMKYKPNPISHTPQISNINVGHRRCRIEVTLVMLFMSIDQRGSTLRNA